MAFERTKFSAPDGTLINGYEADIYFEWDGKDGAHKVWIIADPRSGEITDILEDEADPNHERWMAWDTEFFFYCDSDEEFQHILTNGSNDGWFILAD